MKPLFIKILIIIHCSATAQHVQRDLPPKIDANGYYLFYLHGGVVTVKGDNAINDPVPQFGPYQYSRILDSLQAHGFHVISERRMPNVDDTVYALKIKRQVDTLLSAGVSERNIILVGASAGSHVVILASDKINNPEMKYVIMGGCWSELYKEYLNIKLPGKFLSVREQSDRRGSCGNIFEKRKEVKKFEEVLINTGLDHGFIYRPFSAWVDVVTQWFEKNTRGYTARKAAVIDGPQNTGTAQINVKVLSKELILSNPPFKACHSSSILEIKPGHLMAAFFAGSGEGQKDVAIWLSRKHGEEWTKAYRIADGVINDSSRYPCWNPVLFRSREGRVFLFYKVGPNPREWWGMMRVSDDEGKTWSDPQKLPDGILGPIKNKPVQLDDGVILNPSSIETDSTWKVHVERSDDLGKTWKKVLVDSLSNYKVIQPSILFHGGSRLQVVCRSDQDSIVDSWSLDNGLSWSAFSKLNLPNPNSGIDAITLKNGFHILVYNPEVKGKQWFNNRGKLSVAYSSDGKDWKPVLELEDTKNKEFSYPAIIQTSDGLVHITYTYDRQNIKYVCLKVEGK